MVNWQYRSLHRHVFTRNRSHLDYILPKPSIFLEFAISIKQKRLINDIVVSLYSILALA